MENCGAVFLLLHHWNLEFSQGVSRSSITVSSTTDDLISDLEPQLKMVMVWFTLL